MASEIKYLLAQKYKRVLGSVYGKLKKFIRSFSGYYTWFNSYLEGLRLHTVMQTKPNVVNDEDIKKYKKKWKVLSSRVPSLFMRVYPAFSQIRSSDYVPDGLFFTHIEPMLNNIEYSRSFADKNLYHLLIDVNVLPEVFLRKIHGRYLDSEYREVRSVNKFLQELAKDHPRMVFKYAIESQGGKNIAILKSNGKRLFCGEEPISREWLDKGMGDNFLLQQFVVQHPFYAAFNHSSLNTVRVYTYRSVKDESIHVLQTILRVGKEGALLDNISMGGKACGVSSDGKLNGVVCDIEGKIYDSIGAGKAKEGMRLHQYEQIVSTAKSIAEKQFYTRLIGFDFCVDHENQIRLIELNNFDVGVDILQQCNGPLFGPFTDEIIQYCRSKRKSFRHIIR